MSDLPEVYIYMLESMDGIGTGSYLEAATEAVTDYFQREYSFGSKAILCGRPTYEQGLPGPIDLSKFKDAKVERVDFIAPKKNDYYTIAIDPKGKLKWTSGFFCIFEDYGRTQKANSVTILTEEVKDDYLAYLKSIEVSYIFAGKDKIDLKTALTKLKKSFGIERVLCEGGPTTNGLLLQEDLVQKVIFYKCPYIAAPGGKPVFGVAKESKWNLETFEMMKDKSTLILSYTKA